MQKFLILIGFAWGIFISNSWAGERCIDVFSNSSFKAVHLKISFSLKEKKVLNQFVERMRQTAVERIKARHHRTIKLLPTGPFKVNDSTYRVTEILGAGNEGLVVLAEGALGVVKIKFFETEPEMIRNINSLVATVAAENRPEMLDVDFINRIIAFKITPGIVVGELLSYGADLPRSLVIKILEVVADYWDGDSVLIHNSILDFNSGQIYLFDPH